MATSYITKDQVGFVRPSKETPNVHKLEVKKKLTAIELGEFCKEKKCKHCKIVNFGNGVRIPHCVLRGWEVRPHSRCKYAKEFLEFAHLTVDDLEVEIETIREKD